MFDIHVIKEVLNKISSYRLRHIFVLLMMIYILALFVVYVSSQIGTFDTNDKIDGGNNAALSMLSDIAKLNKFETYSGTLSTVSNNLKCAIKLDKQMLKTNHVSNISINGEQILNKNLLNNYTLEDKNGILTIIPKFVFKPSVNILELSDDSHKFTYNYRVSYKYDKKNKFEEILWRQIPNGWVSILSDGLQLSPPENKRAYELAFSRKFISDVSVASSVIISGTPVNFTIFIGRTSIVFGTFDNKTIQIIQTKQNGNDVINPIVWQRGYKSRLIRGNEYVFNVAKRGSTYTVNIIDKCNNVKTTFPIYIDEHPELTNIQRNLEVGFRMLKDGTPIIIKSILIDSGEQA